jgi:hypothetical protein
MVAAPYKKHQNDAIKWIQTVHTQELNWMQNNSIFLDSIGNLKKNKIKVSSPHFSPKKWQWQR